MELFQKKTKKNKAIFMITNISVFIITITSIYALYALSLLSGIEDMLRFFASLIVTILWALMVSWSYKQLSKNKASKCWKFLLTITIYSLIIGTASFLVDRTFGRLSNVSNNSVTYSTSIVTLNDNTINNIDKIDDGEIGMLSDKESIDGYQIPQEIIKKNKLNNTIIKYDNFIDLLDALYKGKVTYAFLPTNYEMLFSSIEGYEDLKSNTKIIYTLDKKIKTELSGSTRITKPFTILLMGVDSEKENIAGSTFNGDALMLITFNPNTLNSTILSIPRDTYVPIDCFSGKRENKITHAAWYGQDCMINTIENFTGINIDYFIKINFKGVVDLVDSLGGIEVDVPYNFCESNSNREFGKGKTIYVEEGLHTLDGEEVLALARNRHPNPDHCSSKWTNYSSNDFVRGENQQLILKALLSKLKDVRDINTINNILDTISNNVETNMATSEILSLYNVGKSIINVSGDINPTDLFGMQRLHLSGYDSYIYDYSLISKQGTKLLLYNFVVYNGSLTDVVNAMKINLGLIEDTPIKTFSFSIKNPYKETIIGKNDYSDKRITLVPSFFGRKETEAIGWGEKNNIKVTTNYVTSDNPNYYIGMIITQNAFENMDAKYIGKNGLIIDVIETITSDTIDCSKESNSTNEFCIIPNFVGSTKDDVINWFSERSIDVRLLYTEIKKEDSNYEVLKSGKVSKQSVQAGISIYTLINKTFTIEYME